MAIQEQERENMKAKGDKRISNQRNQSFSIRSKTKISYYEMSLFFNTVRLFENMDGYRNEFRPEQLMYGVKSAPNKTNEKLKKEKINNNNNNNIHSVESIF